MASHGTGSQECREIFARLSEYLDGELDPAMCEAMQLHLGDCAPCQEFLESLRRTVGLLNRVPGEPMPEGMRRDLREAFQRLKQDTDR